MDPITVILFGLAALAAMRPPTWWIVQVREDAGEQARWFVAGEGDGAKAIWSKLLALSGLTVVQWKSIQAPNNLTVIAVQGRSPTLTKNLWLPAAYFVDSEQADDAEAKLQDATKAGFKDPLGAMHKVEWRTVNTKIPKQVMADVSGQSLPAVISGEGDPLGALGALCAIRR